MMPSNGLGMRKAQLGYLGQAAHDIVVSDAFDDALTRFEENAGSETDEAIVRELRHAQRRKKNVPRDLVKKISDARAETLEIWRGARENEEYDEFAAALQDMIDLKREEAQHINPEKDPYEVLFENFEPHVSLSTVEDVFDQLTTELPRRLERVKEADVDIPEPFQGSFDEEKQERLAEAVMRDLGLGEEESRIDLSTHPFTIGTPFETRITTRIDETDLSEVLTSTIHESGHGLYQVGLSEEQWWNPLGWDRDLTIHESQSRFYENHVGKRKAFFEYLLPVLRRRFRGSFDDVSSEDAYVAMNQVKEDNYIRTEADQLTYHLHVALRFELGRDLINGDLKAKDLPEAWKEKMESYLGLTPPNLKKGCLQDIHWAQGNFGYFPTYTLGSLTAAQLASAISDDVDVDEAIRTGSFDEIRSWHENKIHRHGSRHTTQRLIKQVTGSDLRVDAYLEHIDTVLDDVYDITV
jgi:carboxypeptidase Taq